VFERFFVGFVPSNVIKREAREFDGRYIAMGPPIGSTRPICDDLLGIRIPVKN
jgi:hypothetical protein